MLALLLLLIGPAAAVGPAREPLPAREVERGLILPKGWTEVSGEVARKRADARWSSDGEPVALPGRYTRITERVTVRHGVAPGHELWLTAPWHQARREGPDRAEAGGVGDAAFGWRWQVLRREPPSAAIAVEVGWEGDTAAAGDLPLGSGTSALWVGLAARRQVGGLALTGRVGAGHRLAGRVPWLDERLDPGDLLHAEFEALLQAGPVAITAAPEVTRRGGARLGPRGAAREVEGSDAVAIDLRLGLTLALTRAVELGVEHARPVRGQGFAFPWVEELSPTLGPTTSGSLTVRF